MLFFLILRNFMLKTVDFEGIVIEKQKSGTLLK